MAIGIFVEYKGQVTQLPVNPEELKTKNSANNESTTSIALGEITQMSFPKLSEVTFTSFFPRDTFRSYVLNKSGTPETYVRLLKNHGRERALSLDYLWRGYQYACDS